MDHIAVIIVNYNNPEDTLLSIASVYASTGVVCTPLVVDNGSTDDSTARIATAFPDVVLLKNATNEGFTGGNNRAIQFALKHSFTHICLLNNDATVSPECLHELLTHSDTNTILGGHLRNAHNHDILDHLGGIWNSEQLHFDLVGACEPATQFTTSLSLDYVCGCLLFAHRTIFENVGLLYAPYFLYWEESDFCFRAKEVGCKVQTCPTAIAYHKGALQKGKKSPNGVYYTTRNRLLFLKRHASLTWLEWWRILRFALRRCKHFLLHLFQYPYSRNRHRIEIEWAEVQGFFHGLVGRFGKK